MPKLFNEGTFYRRVAKYNLSDLNELTESFLNQGCNFIDKKLLLHCNCCEM